MKPTILHISKYYAPYEGGIETVAKYLAHGLSDYNNVVVCYNTEAKNTEEEIDGIKVYRAAPQFNMAGQDVAISYMTLLRRLLRTYKPVAAHLHCPNPFLYPICLTLLPKNVKLVVHWHSDILAKGMIYNLVKPFERSLLKRADMIMATSPNYLHPDSPIYAFKEKVRVVQNGFIVSNFRLHEGDEARIEAIKAQHGHRPLLIFVGRHIPYKGIDCLIRSEAFIKTDCRIIIAGRGPETERLKALAKGKERIYFAGRLSDDDLRCHYYASRIFAFPSVTKQEAFGVVLAEAMYCGCVPVTFEIAGSGVNWVSLNDKTGIVAPLRDERAYAAAVDRLLTDNALYERYQTAGRERVLTMFTDEIAVREAAVCYKELLTKGSKR